MAEAIQTVDIGDPRRLHNKDEQIVPQNSVIERAEAPDGPVVQTKYPITGARTRLRGIANLSYNK